MTQRLTAAPKDARHLSGERVLCLADGSPITRDRVIKAVRGARRVAGIEQGVHILRHTFCSHLAMKGHPRGPSRSSPATRSVDDASASRASTADNGAGSRGPEDDKSKGSWPDEGISNRERALRVTHAKGVERGETVRVALRTKPQDQLRCRAFHGMTYEIDGRVFPSSGPRRPRLLAMRVNSGTPQSASTRNLGDHSSPTVSPLVSTAVRRQFWSRASECSSRDAVPCRFLQDLGAMHSTSWSGTRLGDLPRRLHQSDLTPLRLESFPGSTKAVEQP